MSYSKLITKETIPDLTYEGYYWYSDESAPELLLGQKIDTSIFTLLPFVIEANFYNEAQKISIQVKNIDGQYYFYQYDLKGIKDFEEKTYLVNGFLQSRNFSRYRMIEAWEEVSDAPINTKGEKALAGMSTLQIAWSAFAGFEK